MRSVSLAVLIVPIILSSYGGKARGDRASKTTIYRYVNGAGRPVFMNDRDRIPERYRAKAKAVDLSLVSTNPTLGRELKEALDEEVERLTASGYCVGVRQRAEAGWFRTLWDRHGHLLLLGALALLLIGASPWITARVPGPQWGRVLLLVLPILAMVAIWSTAVVETTHTLEGLRASALPCRPESYRTLPETPVAQRKRLGMLGDLERRIQAMNRNKAKVLDRILDEAKAPKNVPFEVRGLP